MASAIAIANNMPTISITVASVDNEVSSVSILALSAASGRAKLGIDDGA